MFLENKKISRMQELRRRKVLKEKMFFERHGNVVTNKENVQKCSVIRVRIKYRSPARRAGCLLAVGLCFHALSGRVVFLQQYNKVYVFCD